MKNRLFLGLMIALAMCFIVFTSANADGIIIPDPIPCQKGTCPPIIHPMEQLVIRYHRVEVTITNQVAVTHVDQVFYNPNDYPIEGVYIFPIPIGAAVDDFVLWVDGEPVHGEVLDAESARNKYEEIVRSLRDPALLEYVGRGAVQARIFPIQPKGERRVELEYSEVLTADNDLVRYIYPLNTEKFSALPLESVSIKVDVNTEGLGKIPVRAIYSPSHNISINKLNDYHFTASYEENNVLPTEDFTLYYSLGKTEAFHLFSYRNPGDEKDPDGFFLLLLAPKPGETERTAAKDVILVLDRSGSMEGEKFSQAQEALKYILSHLNRDDRFFIITFSDSIQKFSGDLQPVEARDKAIQWVDSQHAAGSTDINRALLEAMTVVDQERPTYLIFLTDGLPTSGVVSTDKIIAAVSEAAPRNVRLFSFGVGYDVDTFLLDTLSQEHHGTSTYVKPQEPIDEVLSGFYEKISTPVLTNLSLDFGNIIVYDVYPDPLPDLFSGSQIIIVGRYKTGGETDVEVKGEVNGNIQRFTFKDQVFIKDSRGEITTTTSLPRLWATRKIGYLLNKIRLYGADKETIDQIIYLSIRYGIVTPYTSYLVTEPLPLGEQNQQSLSDRTFKDYQTMPTSPSFGQEAVEKAQQEGELSQAEVPESIPEEVGDQIKVVGERTFINTDGVWIDTRYDPDHMVTYKVAFLSDDYFELLTVRPEIGSAMALGQRVIIVIDSKAYEIVSSDEEVEDIQIPTLGTNNQEKVTETSDLVFEPSNTPKPASDKSVSTPTAEVQTGKDTSVSAKYLLLGTGGVMILLTILLIFLRMKRIL